MINNHFDLNEGNGVETFDSPIRIEPGTDKLFETLNPLNEFLTDIVLAKNQTGFAPVEFE